MALRKNRYVPRTGVGAKDRHRPGGFKMGRGRPVKSKKTSRSGFEVKRKQNGYEELLGMLEEKEDE